MRHSWVLKKGPARDQLRRGAHRKPPHGTTKSEAALRIALRCRGARCRRREGKEPAHRCERPPPVFAMHAFATNLALCGLGRPLRMASTARGSVRLG